MWNKQQDLNNGLRYVWHPDRNRTKRCHPKIVYSIDAMCVNACVCACGRLCVCVRSYACVLFCELITSLYCFVSLAITKCKIVVVFKLIIYFTNYCTVLTTLLSYLPFFSVFFFSFSYSHYINQPFYLLFLFLLY